ncbi:MAG TPA: Rne/Rng family ribonuclease [Thermoanaerobaculia bacterium]|nr:Rne/Rng family ribonuclease [Thermoanaerobaculia bacterium]
MSRKMLINAQRSEELRIAIIQGNNLENYQVDIAESGLTRGNIYRGIIANIQPSLNAAFIDYGLERHGFLSIQDVVPEAYYHSPRGGHPRIEDVLEKGKPIVVQVAKDAIGQKGAALTTSLSLAGRYLVLTPFENTRGVSRKVEDEDTRKKLKTLANGLDLPEGCGIIVRTNALDQTKATLSRDLAALLRLWKRVQAAALDGKGTRLIYTDQDLILQALRDYLDSSIDEVLVDDEEAFQKARAYMQAFMPRGKTQLTWYSDRLPLFSRYGLEAQIDRIYERRVDLPSGGSIVIDGTEALTAIDVNSGRSTKAGTQEETALNTNMEAAGEVARQLRLRDIGGLLVVDFIDMRASKNQRKVEKALKDALKADKARTTVGRISPNGLLEINRQRIQQALQVRTHRSCPTCNGSGRLASEEMVSLSLLRRIEARAASGTIQAVRVGLHPELADAFQNDRRKELSDLEQEFDIKIEIIAAPGLHRPDEQIEWVKRERPLPAPKPKPAAVTLQPWDLALPDGEEEEDEEEQQQAAPPKAVAKGRERGRGRDRGKEHREPAERPKPAQPADTAEPAERVATEETGAEAEARRRKRRRGGRKRKKANGNGLTVGAPGTEAAFQVHSEPGEEDHEPHWEDEGGEAEGGDHAVEAEGIEGSAAGKRDRGRRRRRRRGGARNREDKGGGEPPAEGAPAQEPPPPSWDNPES